MIDKKQPYEKLIDYIKANPNKGLIIPHADIEQIIGIPYRKNCNCLNSKYSYYVSKANNKLTQLSLRLESIQGFGYRIIEDKEYTDSMRRAYNTGVKYINKALNIGNNINKNMLTQPEVNEFNNVYSKVNDANKYLVTLVTNKNNKKTP